MVLEEKHQKMAIEIIQNNRKKKSCNTCYDRGYIGFTPEKTVVPCDKCIDVEKAMEEWKKYVSQDQKLKEDFKELFEEEKEEVNESTDKIEHSEHKEYHSQSVDIKPQKKPTVKKETIIKTTKSTTVRKSGNR